MSIGGPWDVGGCTCGSSSCRWCGAWSEPLFVAVPTRTVRVRGRVASVDRGEVPCFCPAIHGGKPGSMYGHLAGCQCGPPKPAPRGTWSDL